PRNLGLQGGDVRRVLRRPLHPAVDKAHDVEQRGPILRPGGFDARPVDELPRVLLQPLRPLTDRADVLHQDLLFYGCKKCQNSPAMPLFYNVAICAYNGRVLPQLRRKGVVWYESAGAKFPRPAYNTYPPAHLSSSHGVFTPFLG